MDLFFVVGVGRYGFIGYYDFCLFIGGEFGENMLDLGVVCIVCGWDVVLLVWIGFVVCLVFDVEGWIGYDEIGLEIGV